MRLTSPRLPIVKGKISQKSDIFQTNYNENTSQTDFSTNKSSGIEYSIKKSSLGTTVVKIAYLRLHCSEDSISKTRWTNAYKKMPNIDTVFEFDYSA